MNTNAKELLFSRVICLHRSGHHSLYVSGDFIFCDDAETKDDFTNELYHKHHPGNDVMKIYDTSSTTQGVTLNLIWERTEIKHRDQLRVGDLILTKSGLEYKMIHLEFEDDLDLYNGESGMAASMTFLQESCTTKFYRLHHRINHDLKGTNNKAWDVRRVSRPVPGTSDQYTVVYASVD